MVTVVKEIGRGSFGVVNLVKDDSGKFMAEKIVSDVIDILVGIRETDALIRLKDSHPNIVQIRDHKLSIEDDKYKIKQYMEYCSGGSLEDVLMEEFNHPDRGIHKMLGGIRNRLNSVLRIVESLLRSQEMGIYHMDIKTENMLFRREGEICLCDFSNYYLKTPWKHDMEAPVIPIESVMYRPPEIGFMRNSWEGYEKTDVWAMGVIMLEMLGSWEFVQCVDNNSVNKSNQIRDLAEKIRVFQTNYIKRNGNRKSLTTPFHLLFGDRFKGVCPDPEFGKKIADKSSAEYEMLLTAFYAAEYSKGDNIERALNESIAYFKLRKCSDDHELLRRVYQEVLPRVFQVDYEKRWSMKELCEAISGILGEKMFETYVCNQGKLNVGLWERIPDPLWKKCFEEYYGEMKTQTIQYGKKAGMKLPLNAIMFTKHLAEDVLEKLIMGMESEFLIPTDKDRRFEFYENIIAACTFLSSEFLDFIFPYQDCKWFEDKPLNEVAKYLELSSGLLMGEMGSSIPTSDELFVIVGDIEI
jgi:serine/threonine protein kinase